MAKIVIAITAVLLAAGLLLPAFQSAQESNCEPRRNPNPDADGNAPDALASIDKESTYVVYRHHPGILPDMADRNHDHELILAVYERSTKGSVNIHGDLGHHGYAYKMHTDSLPNWLSEVTELLSSGKLKHYTKFGFDEDGLGLEKPSKLAKP